MATDWGMPDRARMPQTAADLIDQFSRLLVRPVDVVEDVAAWPQRKSMRRESRDIADACDRLDVFTCAHHQEPPGRNLVDQAVNIASIALAEYDRAAHDDQRACSVLGSPRAVNAFRLQLGFSVLVEGRKGSALVHRPRLKSVD